MAYTPTTWVGGTAGTEFTSTRMNNLETGVSNAHADIASLNTALGNKVTTPAGGTDGDVLVKSGSTVAWSSIANNVMSVETLTAGFTLANSNKDLIRVNSSSPTTVVLPTGVTAFRPFEIQQAGTGQVTVAGDTGVTVRIAPPATGLKTAGQYSSIQLLCLSSAGVATTPPATNMAARWRGDDLAGANGSAVSSWPESSGQGLPAAVQATSGNQPTIATNSGGTGHKGVIFDGASKFLTLSGTALDLAKNKGALTIFIAIAFTTAVTTGTRTIFALSSGTSATAARVLLGHRDSVSGVPIAGGRRLDANSLASATGTAITTIQNSVLTARYDWTNSDVYLHQNGTLTGSNTAFQTNGSTDNTSSLAGVIGANLAGTGEWFQGHILEILAYNDADASGTLRAGVHSYFQQTYGIASSDGSSAGEWLVSGGVA